MRARGHCRDLCQEHQMWLDTGVSVISAGPLRLTNYRRIRSYITWSRWKYVWRHRAKRWDRRGIYSQGCACIAYKALAGWDIACHNKEVVMINRATWLRVICSKGSIHYIEGPSETVETARSFPCIGIKAADAITGNILNREYKLHIGL